jgi:hypothetical protein
MRAPRSSGAITEGTSRMEERRAASHPDPILTLATPLALYQVVTLEKAG